MTVKQPVPRHCVKVTFADGDSITTEINGTKDEIENYYRNNTFNVGVGPEDNLQKVINVEFLE